MKGYPTIFNGVIFVETPVSAGRASVRVDADLSFKIGAQLKNLNDIKAVLAAKSAAAGCNCVSEFTYGQKSRWLAIDDVAFFGGGVALQLPPDTYREYTEYIQTRDAR